MFVYTIHDLLALAGLGIALVVLVGWLVYTAVASLAGELWDFVCSFRGNP